MPATARPPTPTARPLLAIAIRYRLARTDLMARLRADRLRDEQGAVAIEYVIVAVALLAIAGAIAAALTTLGNDAVEQIPDSVSGAGG